MHQKLLPTGLLLIAGLVGCSESPSTDSGIHSTPDTAEQVQPAPAEVPRDAARRIHESVLVLDAHADVELPDKPSRYAGPDGVSRVDPTKMQAGGVDAVVIVVVDVPVDRLDHLTS